MRRLTWCLVFGTVALAGPGLAPALAADPMPCKGVSFTDADDAPANRDIREGWFSFSGGRLTANLRLEQVDQQLETGATSAEFVMYYSARGASRFASATTDGRSWSFSYGNDSGGDGTPPGTTTGSVRPGPDGVIEIEIPAVHAGEGDRIFSVHARTFRREAAGLTGERTDSAPDSRNDGAPFPYGAEFVVEPCPEPEPEPEKKPEPEQRPQPEPQPGSQPQPQQPGAQPEPAPSPDPPPASQTTPAAEPRFTATVPRLRARSLRRGRSFEVVVRPSARVNDLVVTLRKGTRVVAVGRRASLTRARSVKVEVRRRIAKGAYALRISGRTRSGETVTRTVRVRIT